MDAYSYADATKDATYITKTWNQKCYWNYMNFVFVPTANRFAINK